MDNTDMKNTMENAKALEGAVHDIAHAVAYPMVTEVVKTQVQLTERIGQLEDDIGRLESHQMSMRKKVDASLESVRADLHSAVVEMHNPDDERQAKIELRILRLEEQMTQLIGILSSVANLE